jgi:hypothetical protein
MLLLEDVNYKMKNYWTIQHINACEQAKLKGVLTGDSLWAIEGYENAYQWIMDQMAQRLGCQKCHPIWLWTERPDLRTRWGGEIGSTYILLQVRANESTVLISEYYAWHCVLNNQPLQLYKDEEVDKEESWKRIFDIELLESSPYRAFRDGLHHTKLQGITPASNIDNIKVVKTFIIRNYKSYS